MNQLRTACRLSAVWLSLLCVSISASSASVSAITEEQRRVFQSGAHYFDTEASSVCSGVGIANGSIDRFMQVLAFQESSGIPTADASPASTASGKYQYLDSTWRARYALYGPASAYARAKQAPEPVQDAVAYIEYSQRFRELGNDMFKLALNHFFPAAITDPSKLDTIIGNNVITPRQYANKVVENMGKDVGSNIPLLYRDAPGFDTWLQKAGGEAPTVNGATADCAGINASVVEIAKQELAAGANERDGSHRKYGGDQDAPWCGYFVSWVFDAAGKPFEGGPLPAVSGILDYARQRGYFFARGDASYIPQPGDIVIYEEGLNPFPSHVNIVISYNTTNSTYTSIGGNEGDSIRQQTFSVDNASITGFMRVP